jgi:serine protease inhibitor
MQQLHSGATMKQRKRGLKASAAMSILLAAVLAGCGGGGTNAQVQSPTGGSGNSGSTGGSGETGGSTSDTTPSAVAQAIKNATPVDPAIVAADNAFGLSLFDTLLPGASGGNISISPLSVAMALQILYNGAAGTTQQAMSQTLDLGTLSLQTVNNDNAALQASLTNPDPAVQLVVANSLWLDQNNNPVLPSFTQADQTYYGATVGDLAGAPANVNAWVNSETQGLIPQLLPPAGVYETAIIANVLYFKGQWTTAFDPSNTSATTFTLSDGSQTTAQLMQLTASLPYTSGSLYGSNYQAVRLPYGAGRFSMLIILPDASSDIAGFAADLTASDLNNVAAQLEPVMLAVGLPRFNASYGSSLVPALQTMGMGVAFTSAADFSALAPGFSVGVVEHKTVVEVNETGTVAAGATGIGMPTVVGPLPTTMVMNHPFFYAIEDDTTGELLFIGLLMNPISN